MTQAEISGDPDVFLSIDDLELAGLGIADAVWHGCHRSVNLGPGVEFETHRDYHPGDDLRRINWTLYARQRRLYTRESPRESRKPVYMLVDATGSMGVAHGPYSKYNYATRVLAAMAFLAVRQGDTPSVGVLRKGLENALPPGSGNLQALDICATLGDTETGGDGSIIEGLIESRVLCQKRGFVVLISDFFEDESLILAELAGLRAQGHDVLALQILDPYEVELPESGDFKFVDAESGAFLRTSVELFRQSHARDVKGWRDKLSHEAAGLDVRWDSVTTRDSLVEVVRRWVEVA